MTVKSLKNYARPYTKRDLQRMRAHARKGLSAKECAAHLGRTRAGVAFKAMVERVHFRAINQPAGVQRRPAQRRKLARLRKARAA